MTSSSQKPQPELIPYASHVAHGTGRTPIGIILFAASHLLLGGVIALAIPGLASSGASWRLDFRLFLLLLTCGGLFAIFGGVALLLKGRGAWYLSISCFLMIALCEAGVAATTAGWVVMDERAFDWEFLMFGGILTSITTALFTLCVVVLRYLGSTKARATFGIPPGQPAAGIRWMPMFAVMFFFMAMVIGLAIAVSYPGNPP